MNSKEWPLIVFTLATQMAAGLFMLLWCAGRQLEVVGSQPWVHRFSGSILLITFLLTVVSLAAASLLHLGRPLTAYLAMSNWRTSRLSREIVLGTLFGGLVGLSTLLHWLQWGSPDFRFAVGGATSLVGLVLVWAISRLYMLRTVPAWNSPATPIMFYTTMVLLGSLAMGSGLAITSHDSRFIVLFHVLGLLVLAAMSVQLATFVLHVTFLGRKGRVGARSVELIGREYRQVTIWRLVLLVAGALLFALYVFQMSSQTMLAILSFGLVLLSEVMGRYLFYESYVPVGLEFLTE